EPNLIKPNCAPCSTVSPSFTYHTIRRASAPAIWRNNTGIPCGCSTTIVVRSLSVDDFGFQAARYFPGWYLKNFTTPDMGLRFTCTLTGDIKTEICRRLSLKYSPSS